MENQQLNHQAYLTVQSVNFSCRGQVLQISFWEKIWLKIIHNIKKTHIICNSRELIFVPALAVMCSPVLASSLVADPVICLPSLPNCPTLHLPSSEAPRRDRSVARRSQPSLLQVTGQTHPRRGSCCPRRPAEGRSRRQMSRLAAGAGIPRQGRGAKREPSPGTG